MLDRKTIFVLKKHSLLFILSLVKDEILYQGNKTVEI
jgi:hypothetical protein